MVIGIIGAGASGMAAAIWASQNPNAQIILFERQARVGRKLQATGNGRCNLSNRNADVSAYHGEDADFVRFALDSFGAAQTVDWFRDMGLFTVTEGSGKVYPYSDQANSVVDVLRFALEKKNISLVTGCEIQRVKKTGEGFELSDGENTWQCHKLIIACGCLAGTKLGGSMSGYKLLSKFGHKCTKLRPALVQIKSDWSGVAALKGVRANCRVQILCDGKRINESIGELQFTEYGLSGPVIFEVSRDVCTTKNQWIARLDFLPDISEAVLLQELTRRKHTTLPTDELLTGILHNRLGRVLTKAAGIGTGEVSQLVETQLQSVVAAVKAFEISLAEPLGMDSAQVTAGGILTEQFDAQTMESKLVSGLYACGEVLDIDGDCGGYNLQWAWSSGRLAGLHAGRENHD